MRHITPKDLITIGKIAERAVDLYLEEFGGHTRHIVALVIADQLLTVHRDVVRLRLDEMLAGSDFDLVHDVFGIHRHLKRGIPAQLTDAFRPRYAVHESKTEG